MMVVPMSLAAGRLFTVLAIFSAAVFIFLSLHMAVDDLVSRTKTVAGHNLEPTPWHPFPQQKDHRLHSWTFLRCCYLACFSSSSSSHTSGSASYVNNNNNIVGDHIHRSSSNRDQSCPSFFRWIDHDLQPWRRSGISSSLLEEAKKHASMRIVIIAGSRLYVDLFYGCVQSRAMFTLWGLLQLLRRYPNRVPDVDLMFDCMDRPALNRSSWDSPPPPLFRYCTTRDHFDIPFPDWSFWGWPEINIKPWGDEFRSIKIGSESTTWMLKDATAYWKGNPDVQSPIRMSLLSCNDSKIWKAQIMRQDWVGESSSGFKKSQLSSQCDYRYKIYAEGYAWSVSLKYILACGSLALIIDPQYEDFFTRGLIPKENYWPISQINICQSIKSAVEWGNEHPSEAEAIGNRGQDFMQDLGMDRVYDYMFHLIVEYSKLQDFKPVPPSSSQEICEESLLCLADQGRQREFLERSYASPSLSSPCTRTLAVNKLG